MHGCRFRCVATAALVAAAVLAAGAVEAQSSRWPRRIDIEQGQLTIYQPQPESFNGNTLSGRAAAALRAADSAESTFGVFWFTARVDTNRDTDEAVLRDIVVTDVRWPDSEEEQERRVADIITGLMPKSSVPISLEELKASLATAELARASLADLQHEPPQIVFVEELSELLLYDGEPRGVPIPDTEFEHIANSRFAVVADKRSATFYLSGGSFWYSAPDPKGPWAPISAPPADVLALFPTVTEPAEEPQPATAPRIVVATVPTALIASDGPPNWQPIGGAELLYIANTEIPVVREIASGDVFVLLSGRWFRASTFDGPWTVVRPDQLPVAFQNIPPESALGTARVSVAGTPEAEDAMLDAQVPQTAVIDRAKATLEVVYDGRPDFERIEGTDVAYATNSATQVLRIDRKFYAVDEGVWFVADDAEGPWEVAASIPQEEIDQIPPSSPVYNVKHVHVYESTPSVVYVGYTPGYMWSYPWYGVPVYGTGWYYPPYWGSVYYPHPATWGLHVSYNPYTGWGMGVSYSWGFMTVGIMFGGGYGGYYRPGYPPPIYYRPPYYPPGGYRPPAYRPGAPRPTPYAGGGASAGQLPAGAGGGLSAGQLPAAGSSNIYNRAATQDRVVPASQQRSSGLQSIDRTGQGDNNVYADRNGNVHRQTPQGWQTRSNNDWGQSRSAAPSNLNRDAYSRQMGASRSMARPMSRGGGMGRR